MGAYAPLPWAPPGLVDEVVRTIVRPSSAELAARGTPFSGLLYAGLVLTSTGTQVIEFNCRFGDPETQVVLPLLRTPLAGLLHAAATGTLGAAAAAGVERGRRGHGRHRRQNYPGTPRPGDVITGAERRGRAARRHPPSRRRLGGLRGRPGAVGGRHRLGPAAARDDAYGRLAGVHLRGSHHRTDIALRAAEGRCHPSGRLIVIGGARAAPVRLSDL